MSSEYSALNGWTTDQIARARQWVRTWQTAGPALELIRRRELREIDTFRAISLLLADWDYSQEPRTPRPLSGLIEQQRLFRQLHQA
jgi:hypothetical protein